MTLKRSTLRLCLLAACLSTHQAPGQGPIIPDPAGAGQEIAARLRSAGPSQGANFTGTLIVIRPERTNAFPIASTISVTETNWQVAYAATVHGSNESLMIVRRPGQPNEYLMPGVDGSKAVLAKAELFRPFAASDFWRVDLGLDFIFWPEQRQINSQMRRGRACRVLESRNPNPQPGEYARVVSWVDVETDGILKAEAYDHQGKLAKEFLVGRFRKVDGQYQLEEMTIRVPKTGHESTIRFDLDRRDR